MKHLFVFGIIGIILSSCVRNNWENQNDLRNNYVGETAFSEMTNMTDQAIEGAEISYKGSKVNCATITIDTASSPRVIVIDFDSTNCLCNDGKYRRGAIITTWSGAYHQTGTVITHTPVNYYVDDYKIEGTKTVTNIGPDANGDPNFTVEINGTLTEPGGTQHLYTSSRLRKWTEGHTTPINVWDDEYEITGTAHGENLSNNNTYDLSILTPLHYKIQIGCKWPVSGSFNIDLSTLNDDAQVDYGNGQCDYSFTVTYKGNTYTFNY